MNDEAAASLKKRLYIGLQAIAAHMTASPPRPGNQS
jgi:hypothetical protein